MNKLTPRKATLLSLALVVAASLTACGQGGSGEADAKPEMKTIGISTIVSHPDLDTLIQGIQDGLKQEGLTEGKDIKVEVQNAQGNIALATTIAQKFAADKVDVIVGVSTPSSLAAVKATENSSIPVIFTGVSADPAAAGLAKPGNEPLGRLVTGVYTPDTTVDQLELFGQLSPDVKKLGFLFNPGEANSVQARTLVDAAAQTHGWSLVDATVTSSNDISAAMNSLVGRVDAVILPQDNTVLTGLPAILKIATENKLPVYSSDTSSVKEGTVATVATNTYEQGVQTAAMLAKILKGTSANDIAPEPAGKVATWVNTTAAENMGVTVPANILETAEIAK
ncbi:ABC transporter substrate-binding protein [Paeniglutamicibacter cryotolerans]|uniref:Putative ABC transport system substrate-binding protein n=1 Tax=Paeniglutamicibacter cryotolerans TaxID=670079 RepID=A0A839QLK6_9MICC|nr:ABC transporter substrate-binding protein [Paeniglutamicibacter cryotolerans]MBB2995644.1 putative ABC transport system substrate-binding protein [Paeniglutamicibacter cryotolerans]